MPFSEAILRAPAGTANDWRTLAVVWHVALSRRSTPTPTRLGVALHLWTAGCLADSG